jgi:hypothetical protein
LTIALLASASNLRFPQAGSFTHTRLAVSVAGLSFPNLVALRPVG